MIDLSQGSIEFKIVTPEPIAFDLQGSEYNITYYEELMAMALIMRANKLDPSITIENPAKVFPYIKHLIEWLRTKDFYTAPASTKYHDAYHGGLLNHSLEVYNQLVGLRSVPKFRKVVDEQWYSAVLVALVHDWCKIGRYESYLRNVQNEDTGIWEKVPAFRYKEDGVARFGHGTQSLIMAMQICNSKYTALTFEEMAAIRWHMNSWDMSDYDVNDLSKCNDSIPLVKMIQFADQLAITNY